MPAGYHLEPSAFSGVLETIEREYASARLSGFQRRSFRWLRVSSWALTLIVAALLALEVLPSPLKPISVLLQVVGTLVVIAVLLLLLLNAPLIAKAVRQIRLASRLRLLDIADAFWLRGARRAPGPAARTLVYLAPSAALLALFLGSLAFGPADQELAVTWGQTAVVLAVCCGLPLVLYGAERLFERLRDRLDHLEEVETLRRELQRLSDAGDESPEISRELAQRLADMERIHILRSQARAVASAERGVEESFSVARTEAFRRAVRELAAPDRQRVEEAILRLTLGPHAPDPSRPERSLRVESTDLVVWYELSEPSRRIRMLRLTRAAPGAGRSDE